MKMKFGKILRFFVLWTILVCLSSFNSFADTVEIKNGVKTTYADKPRTFIDTAYNRYDYKWTLNRRGDWKLYIKKMNGKDVGHSNTWVSIDRTVVDENGNFINVKDYYYFDFYEKMVAGWYIDPSGDVYYLNTDEKELGRMVRGWCEISDDYYYFDDMGVLLKNTITPDGFYVDGEGKWQ